MTQAVQRARTPPRLLQVQRLESLSPRMVRLVLGGEQLAGWPTDCIRTQR